MKIGQELRTQLDTTHKNTPNQVRSNISFQQVVRREQQRLHENELNRLIKDITTQGERLAKSRTFKDLARYKSLVKSFIKEAVQFGLELKEERSWSMNGDSRKLMIVKEVDEKLIQLTDDLLNQEKESIDILGLIGEIKGLLINLTA